MHTHTQPQTNTDTGAYEYANELTPMANRRQSIWVERMKHIFKLIGAHMEVVKQSIE